MNIKIKKISQFEAAYLTGLSPDLLEWLTKYAPKKCPKRKLSYVQKKDDIYFYDKAHVLEFNDWLSRPWPAKKGTRPSIPKGIKREIETEANGSCAVCQGHKDTCEAAHIDPVSVSMNNHPKNIIWLCANHHTAFDKGLFIPSKDIDPEFIVGLKKSLAGFKKMLWRNQHEASEGILAVLRLCVTLNDKLTKATSEEECKAIEVVAKQALDFIPTAAPVSSAGASYEAYKSISKDIIGLSKAGSVKKQLKKIVRIKNTYIAALGYVTCPLCEGEGSHDYGDCPVCGGDREIPESWEDKVDVTDFEKVTCPVCNGVGVKNDQDCPVCQGDKKIERRFLDQFDPHDYEEHRCPLCKGAANYHGRTCPICGGATTVTPRHTEGLDLGDYKYVECPLCEGSGDYDDQSCKECGGDGEMQRRHVAEVNLTDYDTNICPICDGKGYYHNFDECPCCGGECELPKHIIAQLDTGEYEMVDCDVCHSQDDHCHKCGGNGQIMKRDI